MPTTYLCTAGTSADKTRIGGDQKAVYEAFSHLPFDESSMRALSAELHSLFRLGVTAEDRVIFYSSQTPEGTACARALCHYLEKNLPGIAAECQVIEGLQVLDARKFREQGVVHLFQAINADLDRYGEGSCVLNPTGGFKALVPYTALLGMLRNVPVRYIFEQSTQLLELPSFPLDFPTTLLQTLGEVRSKLDIESSLPLAELRKLVDQRTVDLLFEVHGDEATLSAIGYLLLDRLKEKRAKIVYVALSTYKELLQLDGSCHSIDFLQRCAADPGALEKARHASIGQGFIWLKPGNTTDRYLITIEGWKLLVWKAVNHAEYDRLSENKRLGQELANKRASTGPFVRLDIAF